MHIYLRHHTGGNSWEIKSGPGIGGQIFYSIDFSNSILVSTGTLTKYSINSGETWYLGDFPSEPIYSLIASGDKYLGVGGNGYIVKTIHYDSTWKIEQSPTTQNLYSFNNTNYLWAVGANGTILKNIPNWLAKTSRHCK